MNNFLFGLGLFALVLFGSALDSQGWGMWVAVTGTISGMALMVISSK